MNRLLNRWAFMVVSLLLIFLTGCGGDEDIDKPTSKGVGSIRGTIVPAAANAHIQLFRDGQQIATTKPDSNGNYVFADVEPGTYEIVAVADGYKPPTRELVVVVAGQTVTKNFTLDSLVTRLTGVVVAPNGLWIEGAVVTVKNKEGEQTQETDSFGVFHFDAILADVEMTVTVKAEGMAEQTSRLLPFGAVKRRSCRSIWLRFPKYQKRAPLDQKWATKPQISPCLTSTVIRSP